MSSSLNWGQVSASALNSAVNLTEFVTGSHTDTSGSTNGQSNTTTSGSSTVSSQNEDASTTNQEQQTNTDQITTNTQDVATHNNDVVTNLINSLTTTTNTVANSANTGVIQSLTNLANTAMSNANDPSKTNGIISSFIQQAGDALTSIFGGQNQAGLYNSAAASTQAGDVVSRATADAASSILGYQQSQQTLASNALNDLLAATATQTTTNTVAQNADNVQTTVANDDQVTTNTQEQKNSTNQETQTQQAEVANSTASTNTSGQQSVQSSGTSSSSSKSGASIICSWMFKNKILNRRQYELVSKDFECLGHYHKLAYLLWATPIMNNVRKGNITPYTRIMLQIFAARNQYICGKHNYPDGNWPTIKGYLALCIISLFCFCYGLPIYINDRLYSIGLKKV